MPDQSPIEARLYTLNEAADLTGLSVDALRQRIKRRKIYAVRGNDGLVRVRLDGDVVEALKTGRPPSRPTSQPPSQLAGESLAIRGLETAIDALRNQLERAEDEKVDLRGQRDRAQGVADQALADLRAERAASQQRDAHSAAEQRRLQARIEELESQLEEARARVAEGSKRVPERSPDPVHDAQAEKLWHEIAELQAKLEEVRAYDSSALHQSAWGGESGHDAAADPTHQVERLWQRVGELEHRLEEARAIAEPQSAEPEPEAAALARTAETIEAMSDSPADRPQRWWRRVFRRR